MDLGLATISRTNVRGQIVTKVGNIASAVPFRNSCPSVVPIGFITAAAIDAQHQLRGLHQVNVERIQLCFTISIFPPS